MSCFLPINGRVALVVHHLDLVAVEGHEFLCDLIYVPLLFHQFVTLVLLVLDTD